MLIQDHLNIVVTFNDERVLVGHNLKFYVFPNP